MEFLVTFRNVSDLALAFLLLKEILYFLVILLQTIYWKSKSTAILSGQNLFLSFTGENWHSLETWNVWFLLDLFIQLQSINLQFNEIRVFRLLCTSAIYLEIHSHEVLRFGWVGFFLWEELEGFFSHPFLPGKIYFGLFFSWAKCFSNNGLIFLYRRMNLASELDGGN